MFGMERREFKGTYEAFLEAMHPEDREMVNQAYTNSLETRTPYEIDHRLLMKDGSVKFVHEQCENFFDGNGSPLRSIGTVQDITGRKQAEAERQGQLDELQMNYRLIESLARSESLEQTFDAALDALLALLRADRASILLFDAAGVMRFIAWRGLSDEYRKAVDGHSPWTQDAKDPQPILVEEIDHDPGLAQFGAVFEDEGLKALAFIPLVQSGRLLGKFMIYFDTPHRFAEDEIRTAKTIAAHIGFAIERKRVEEAMRESEERYRQLVENSPIGIYRTTPDGRILASNPALVEMLGFSSFEELATCNLEQTPNSSFSRRAFKELLEREGRIIGLEAEWRKSDGTTIFVRENTLVVRDTAGTVVAYDGTVEDITPRKQAEAEKAQLEEQLRRSQKLETIGTLAGGIAHDFNNILTPIMGYAEMALFKLKDTEPLYRDLQQVLKAARRAKDLVEQILLFAKQREKEQEPLYLQPLVQEALKLLRPSIPATIEISQRIDASCEKVRADATQIHQVIVNLCTNAWQAMEEKGGTLTIELKPVAIAAGRHPNLTAGEYIRLSVIDSGTGMDKQTLDRIFDPFFTTKAVDKGTGLGLSVVHGIVHSHRGDIQVESEPGKGSVFHVYLPVYESIDQKTGTESKTISGGEESILVVDDDENVAVLIKAMLDSLGYKVEIYHGSLDALKVFRRQPEKYDLLLSDFTMPDMTGLDLAKQVQITRPGFPVMIMTGYGDSLNADTLRSYGIKQVVGKPLAMRELAAAVRSVLDKK
jgi:PAS domain S-box-containing protein